MKGNSVFKEMEEDIKHNHEALNCTINGDLTAEEAVPKPFHVVKSGLCKDCKYFTEVSRPNCIGFDDEPIFEGKKIGVCSCSKFVYLWSDRYNKYFSGEEYEELVIEDDMLTYEDYEGYSASFNVGENFGCVHFKERENG